LFKGGRTTARWRCHAGYFVIIGVESTATTVHLRFAAHVRGSMNGVIRDFAPGEEGGFKLGLGDVLQIVGASPERCPDGSSTIRYSTGAGQENEDSYCNIGADYDLTASDVEV